MTPLDRLLARDEEVYLQLRPHAAAIVPALARAGAVVAACVALTVLALRSEPPLWRIAVAVLATIGAVAVARAAGAVWRWQRTLLAITSQHVLVLRAGGRSVASLPLESVRRLGLIQSPLGRLLGYGTLELADGTTRRSLRYVPRPAQAHLVLLRLADAGRRP